MASAAPVTAVFGSTGLVGSNILSTLLASPSFGAVHTVSRRAPKVGEPAPAKLHATVEAATEQWAGKIGTLQPAPTAVFSALGTTRAQAGGIANQWKIDHDLNVEVAEAAKKAGVSTFVFVSSAGTQGLLSASVPYSKMKLGVEAAVKKQEFDHAIILRPGFIHGQREKSQGFVPNLFGSLIGGLGKVYRPAGDALGQDALVIGRAAVAAALLASQGKAPSKYWVLEQADIVRLGRDEWKE